MAAFRSISGFRGEGSVRGWLMRIATRQAFRRLAQRRPTADLDTVGEPLLADPSGDPTASWSPPRRSEVRSAVAALPDPYRETVALRFFGELSLAEIAEATGRPLNTVKTHLRRGLDRLRPRSPRRPTDDPPSLRARRAGPGRPEARRDRRAAPGLRRRRALRSAGRPRGADPCRDRRGGDPAVGWWARLFAPWRGRARAGLGRRAVVAAAVVVALVVGDIADLVRGPIGRVLAQPARVVSPTPSPTPTPSPSPRRAQPTPTASSDSPRPATPAPSARDDRRDPGAEGVRQQRTRRRRRAMTTAARAVVGRRSGSGDRVAGAAELFEHRRVEDGPGPAPDPQAEDEPGSGVRHRTTAPRYHGRRQARSRSG